MAACLVLVRENALVHAGSVIGEVEGCLEPFLDVIGIQDSELAGLLEVRSSHGPDIAVSPDHHPNVPVESVELADGLRKIAGETIFPLFLYQAGHRKKGFKVLLDTHRTRSRATSSMRCGKGFVKIEMKHVQPGAAHIHHAQNSVHVCPIPVHKPAFGVDEVHDLFEVFFKKTEGVGIGDHDSCCVLVHRFGHAFNRENSLVVRRHRDGSITAEGCTGGVCAVGCVRHKDLWTAFAAPALVVRVNEEHSGEFPLSSGCGLKGHGIHACDLGQKALKLEHEPEEPLGEFLRAEEDGHRQSPAKRPACR